MTSEEHAKQHSRKAFYPLESDPELFTTLVHDLGLAPTLAFHDVLSIDEPDLLRDLQAEAARHLASKVDASGSV